MTKKTENSIHEKKIIGLAIATLFIFFIYIGPVSASTEPLYDSQGNLLGYRDGTSILYQDMNAMPDAFNYLEIIDGYRIPFKYNYDSYGKITKENSATGIVDYGYTNELLSSVDDNGLTTTIDYNSVDAVLPGDIHTKYEKEEDFKSAFYSGNLKTTIDFGGDNVEVCTKMEGEEENCAETGEVFNDAGAVTEDPYWTHEYNSDNSLQLIKKTSKSIKDDDGNLIYFSYEYNDDGTLDKVIYPGGEKWEKYYYDPIGDFVKLVIHDDSGSHILTGFAIRDLFSLPLSLITGKAGSDASSDEEVFYATIPGDMSSAVSEEELGELLSQNNLDPELEQILDDYSVIETGMAICSDRDQNETSSFEQSLFISSAVFYRGNAFRDTCENNSLREYYCGLPWYLTDGRIRKSTVRNCTQYGAVCSNGACKMVPTPITNQTCTDSDGGRDYFVKGTVNATRVGEASRYFTDTCINPPNTVLEFSCDAQNEPYPEHRFCADGCSDGTCIIAKNETQLELPPEPKRPGEF